MGIKTKKPMVKESVGALYYAFNKPTTDGEFDAENYEDEVVKSEVVKNISTTENADSVIIRASGKVYDTVNSNEYIDMAVEVVAIDPADLAKMRADKIGETGLNRSGGSKKRPFFAFGKVKKLLNNGVEYAWYPKCQLVENTDDISTKEENFSEQNDTITIRAYDYNKDEDKKTWVNSEMSNFPEGLTEEQFFTKPILTDEDLAAVMKPTTEEENEGA
ncbi:MAG: phage tail protein [Clostridia bacterium]|nr:phage tail protein [Clostridia bacterium]